MKKIQKKRKQDGKFDNENDSQGENLAGNGNAVKSNHESKQMNKYVKKELKSISLCEYCFCFKYFVLKNSQNQIFLKVIQIHIATQILMLTKIFQ